jgi:hypothetical protein
MASFEQYWQATDYVFELARDLVLDREDDLTGQVERLLDFNPRFLNRILTNIGVAQSILLAEAVSMDLSNPQVFNVLLPPLNPFSVVEGAGPSPWDEFAKRVWHAVNSHDNSTDDLEIHLSFEASFSPAAVVLNSAMPVIYSLLFKALALQPVPGPIRPADEGNIFRPHTRTSNAIAAIRARLHSWLGT